MKKTKKLVLAIFMVFMMIVIYPKTYTVEATGQSQNEDIEKISEYKDYTYRELAKGVEIIGYSGQESTLSIPDKINKKPVISIGSLAFYENLYLEKLELPDSVETVKRHAFYRCENLTEIKLGKNIAKIGESAFYNCNGIEKLILSDKIENIGRNAFGDIKEISIPADVESIPYSLLKSELLEKIELSSKNKNYVIEDGILYDNSKSVLIKMLEKDETSVKIPKSVKKIAPYAFLKTNIKSLEIPDDVENIGKKAFYKCENLEKLELGKNTSKIGEAAFASCSKLERLSVSDRVESIGKDVFSNTSLKKLIIGESVESIPTAYFRFHELEDIYLSSGNKNYKLEDGIFYNKSKTVLIKCIKSDITRLDVLGSVENIGDYAFNGCKELEEVVLPENIKKIGRYAFCTMNFEELDKLEKVRKSKKFADLSLNILNPSKLKIVTGSPEYIGEYAFAGCTELKNIELSNKLKKIEKMTFFRCENLEKLELEGNIASIGEFAFYGCENLLELVIPNNVKEIGSYAFSGLIGSESDNNGIQYIYLNRANKLQRLILEDGIKEIGEFAFYGCEGLTSVTIPNSISTIERATFDMCKNLNSVTLPETVETIEERGFRKWYGDFVNYIYGASNSYAQQYALENKIEFIESQKVDELGVEAIADKVYTGEEIRPEVIVKNGDYVLVEGQDYIVDYKNNEEIGVASVIVIGQNKYISSKKIDFKILPKKVSKIKLDLKKDFGIKLSWKEDDEDLKYQIYRAESKNGKYKKVATRDKNYYVSYELNKGDSYYYKVRAYKMVDGEAIYGDFSDIKYVKVK